MAKNLTILTSVILLFFLFMFVSCCDDCPTCGDEEPPELGNYRIYALSTFTDFLIAIDTPSDSITDSVVIDYHGMDVFVTPDGKQLMVMNQTDYTMELYNAKDLSHVGTHPRYGDYYFDTTDNYGLCVSYRTENLLFINTTTLMPEDSLDVNLLFSYLDTVNNIFWGSDLEEGSVIYKIDCNTHQILDTIHLSYQGDTVHVIQLAYNWYDDYLYFHAGMGGRAFFMQYDITNDSITHITWETDALGGVTVSSDGRYVYWTDSGNGAQGIFPDGYVYVVDVLSHSIIDAIPPYSFPGGHISLPFFGEIIYTPDKRRLYVGSNNNAWAEVPIEVIDLYEGKVIDTILPNMTFWPDVIALGPGLAE